MTVLTVDPISAKTLPVLDRLYNTDMEKFTSVIHTTEGAPLKRLVRSSIARQVILGHPDSRLGPTAALLEDLIQVNLRSYNAEDAESRIDRTLDEVAESTLRLLLNISIVRFNILK